MSSTGVGIRGLWQYYWVYVRTRVAMHAAATAALTLFGLLMYFHRGFIVLAVASYLLPPIYLYLAGDDPESARNQQADEDRDTETDFDDVDIDTDSDGTDTDTDADGVDADADADSTDADADADGADADADADGVDRDIDN
jgi:hypothetical protein